MFRQQFLISLGDLCLRKFSYTSRYHQKIIPSFSFSVVLCVLIIISSCQIVIWYIINTFDSYDVLKWIPFFQVGGNKMFKMLYDSNFTFDSSMPIYENKPPSWPYTLDYKLFHDCMIPPCPTRSYPGVWEVPMVMWQDLNGGRCSMGDACSNPPEAAGVTKLLLKNFERHYTTNR